MHLLMRDRRLVLLSILLLGLLVGGCRGGGQSSPAPTLEPGYVPTSVAKSLAAAATHRASLTTPTSTATPAPTSTSTPVEPTATATVAATPTPSSFTGVVNADGLRLRAGPGTSFAVIRALYEGDEVTVTARLPDDDWLAVVAEEAVSGWVSAQYIDVSADLEFVPLAVDIPATPEPTDTPTPASD